MLNAFDILKNIGNLDDIKKQAEDHLNIIKDLETSGESGGGFVKVTINGEFEILSIDYVDNELIKNDLNTFRDLIIVAHNNAVSKMAEEIRKKVTFNVMNNLRK